MAKRVFDVLVATGLLALLAPLLIVLAILVKVDSPGPALFLQDRVGRNGRVFRIAKFRTMVANAADLGGFRTQPGDRRITPMGAFLRRTSLDELPQLFNVVRGDMSLVGPRPDTPMQEHDYTPAQWRRRTSVRPGMTGAAQARLRSAATAEQRLALDLDYVRHPSLGRDLVILAQTVSTLLSRKVN